jgi:hypothetical protein
MAATKSAKATRIPRGVAELTNLDKVFFPRAG